MQLLFQLPDALISRQRPCKLTPDFYAAAARNPGGVGETGSREIQSFARLSVYLKEGMRWNCLVGFALIAAAVFFIFKKW